MMEYFLAMLRHSEGLRLKAYLCPAGVATIGYGQTGPGIKLGVAWTLEEAEAQLRRSANVYLTSAQQMCPQVVGDEGKVVALADFAYDLGIARLAGSTLKRYVVAGSFTAAANEFPKWVRGGGRILPGLVARRKIERELFLNWPKLPAAPVRAILGV
jgi:lysozyme